MVSISCIVTENELEELILNSEQYEKAEIFGNPRPGHPEGTVGLHVKQILEFIDKQDWEKYRKELRILALLHDIGKPLVKYSENGHVIDKGHSAISEGISRKFSDDERLLYLISIHNKYIHHFRDEEKNRFNERKFVETYLGSDLELLTRFHYADSNNREKDSSKWFDDKSFKLGLKNYRVYELEPGVLR